ncbi:Hypothetical predicted protein [Cloeon dipterum]|uniref:Uncharacterized protein n=1 Tax=Cloeon dipterum TaxID=197152 RepID=A0A8S1CPB9_9INSE|nr:Hypothetical predicted protein [Cloeon dipterum]
MVLDVLEFGSGGKCKCSNSAITLLFKQTQTQDKASADILLKGVHSVQHRIIGVFCSPEPTREQSWRAASTHYGGTTTPSIYRPRLTRCEVNEI